MTLGLAHEASLALAASVSFLIALMGGAMSPFAWGVLLAPLISIVLKVTKRAAPATSGTVIALASVGLGVATFVQRGSEAAVLAGGYALMGLLVARLLTRVTLAHDLQALLLSLVLVVAAAVLNVKLSYAPLFVGYGVAVVWALITRELLRGAERASAGDPRRLEALRARTDVVTGGFLLTTSAVAALLLLATSLLFVLFPRVGFESFAFSSGPGGRLPASVSLRGLPRGSVTSGEVVARVTGVSYDAFLRGLYLRGAVYDVVDEQGFSRGERAPRLPKASLALADAPEETGYEVYLSPGAGTTLLALGRVRGVTPLSGGRTNPNHRLYIGGLDERTELHASDVLRTALRYRVQGGVAAPGAVPEERSDRPRLARDGEAAPLFALPDDLDPRVLSLAKQLRQGASDPVLIAERLRTFLLREFTYSLEQPNASAEKPLTAFLLDDRRGHCEYFAAAYALLLRASGIAARVIGGYQGGLLDTSENVVVFTGANAHAWVEWFLPGAGWITDDPTPLASAPRAELSGLAALVERITRFWDDRVLDYAFGDQIELARRAQRALSAASDDEAGAEGWRREALLVAALVVVVVAALAWRRRRRSPARRGSPRQDALTTALLEALARYRGSAVRDTETLREAAGALPALPERERAVLEAALALYERGRFAGAAVDDVELARAALALRALPLSPDGAAGGAARGPLTG